MKREILFRGKLFNNNSWVYGGALIWNGNARIIQHIQCLNSIWTTKTHDVKIESVGQFTGLKDINGVKIFEGDICSVLDVTTKPQPSIGVVEYTSQACFEIFEKNHHYGMFIHNPINMNNYISELNVFMPKQERTIEVIGNIYDNPELLK